MGNKITGLVMLSVVLIILSGIVEMTYFGATDTARLKVLMTAPSFGESLSTWGMITAVVDFTWDWFVNLMGMMTFSYAFFEGQWQIVRYILFVPIGIGVIAQIVAMIRGTSA